MRAALFQRRRRRPEGPLRPVDRKGATHLIKVAVEAAVGKRDHVSVYGTDYDTPDGTGVRDYIHVSDLAAAHVAALEKLIADPDESHIMNCGYGRGFSVLEVLDAVDRVTNLRIERRGRRPGDPDGAARPAPATIPIALRSPGRGSSPTMGSARTGTILAGRTFFAAGAPAILLLSPLRDDLDTIVAQAREALAWDDIWRPELSEAERRGVSAIFDAIDAYSPNAAPQQDA
jgi:hypothetical protein